MYTSLTVESELHLTIVYFPIFIEHFLKEIYGKRVIRMISRLLPSKIIAGKSALSLGFILRYGTRLSFCFSRLAFDT